MRVICPVTLLLLCAWCQDDFALLQSVVRNGDDPFAAFALDFEIIPTKFCDKLAAFTSGFGRLELLPQPPGVSVKIHRVKIKSDENVTNQSLVCK